MDELPRRDEPSGWSFGKVVGVILGLIGMVGFGVCTLCGVVISFDSNMNGIWPFILVGGLMTFLSVWFVRNIYRKVREAREGRASDSSNTP